MKVEELVNEVASWLDGTGPMSSIVLSSRIIIETPPIFQSRSRVSILTRGIIIR